MANLKEIRNRLVSVNSTRQITSAMKMVSAAKLRKAQDAITQLRPYAEKLREILSNLSSSLDISENPYAEVREVKRVLIIAVTSNRGLAGGFNNNVIKRVNEIIARSPGVNFSVLSLGKKAFDFYKKKNMNAGGGYPSVPYEIYNDLSFDNAAQVADIVMRKFREKKLDQVIIVNNSFKNAAVQIVNEEQFLPILPPASSEKSATGVDYIFEPNKEDIVADLIPKSLKIQLYKSLLDSFAGEHGARMTAMHKATDNATELLNELRLTYNKARQAAITNEILEIVGGAEALNG